MILQGCCKKLRMPEAKIQTKEKIETVYTERDTTIFSPEASVQASINLNEIKPGLNPVEQSNKQAKVKAEVKDNKLLIDCNCDSTAIKAKLIDKETSKEHTVYSFTTMDVPYVPWYVKILAWIGGCSLLVGIGFLLRRFKIL